MALFVGKRGISPLIATFLLIAFSVLLGGVVMSWGKTYIEERAEFVVGGNEIAAGCDAVNLGILSLRNVPQVCRRGDVLEVFLENGPNADLADVHARVVGTAGTHVQQSTSGPLARGSALKTDVRVGTAGTVLQLKLTPVIMTARDTIHCDRRAITVENIGNCV